MTISAAKLDQLLEAALGDPSKEPAFFSALLDAVGHAHCPAGDRSGRLRFVQFHGPDGELLLPFFSDRGKAAAAATPDVRIVSLTGRTFLESSWAPAWFSTRTIAGASSIRKKSGSFLASGRLAVLETTEPAGAQIVCQMPTRIPEGLIERLTRIFAPIEELEAAYLVEMAPAAVPPGQLELGHRSQGTSCGKRPTRPDGNHGLAAPLAVMAMDSDDPLPA